MFVNIQKAVELTGRSRATISRHISNGRLSRTPKGIDIAELIRVYGELKPQNDTKNEASKSNHDNSASDREKWLMKQIDQLNDALRDLKHESLEREKRLMALLENHQNVSKNESQSNGGFFSKLFG